jgi:hypothetical protein
MLAATEQGKPGYRKALTVGWTEERLRMVAVLNAFNRVALGPYAAAFMRTAGVDLGLSRDVLHGSRVRVNSAIGEPVRLALKEFERLSVSAGINLRWLHMTRMSEVIYAINKQADDLE